MRGMVKASRHKFAAGGTYAMHAPYRDLKRGTAEGVSRRRYLTTLRYSNGRSFTRERWNIHTSL